MSAAGPLPRRSHRSPQGEGTPATLPFDGKVAVVTGAANGIGKATAARLASLGARVVLVDLPGVALHSGAAELKASGATALAVAADVTDRQQVAAYISAAIDTYGGIDCFFNNAGILGPTRPITDYPEEDFDRVMNVNVKAAWMGIKLLLPALLRRGGGSIVNTASVAGLRGAAGMSGYSISKHAVIGLTRSVANECAALGVRVNAVCPGPIDTAMGQQLDAGYSPQNPQAGHERVVSRIPMARYGTADEVAALVCFLLSDDASFISGAAYPIDGGMTG